MRRKTGVFWITFCLVFILVIGSVSPITDFDDNDFEPKVTDLEPEKGNVFVAGTPHAPIVIDGDTNFTLTASNEGWDGDGSPQNPFIIQGLDIDQGGSSSHCINISNTRSNFTIQNCNLTGASVFPGSGIYLNNVTFGEIVGNIFDNNNYSIYIWSCHHLLVRNNTCINSNIGISFLRWSSYNTITDNNCSYNRDSGIYSKSGSNNNTVSNNTCSNNSYGIYLESSEDNTVTNNTCSNNDDGIFIAGALLINTLSNNTCNSNTRAGIYLNWTLSHIVANNTCSNNSYGIYLESSNSITVSNNTCYYNNYGICLNGFG
ncbi:MAG: right-handed parallel beta-helix repeat-containing protein, partial [Candidatus Thorarchaeota archaeon]|nr:right-handed parallel beta-helix repeat-containing protein [Candidatus Thorarchaeota archaeon]